MINLIYQKVEVLDMRLDSIDKTMVRHEENLRTHMKRSDHLEALIEHLDKDFKPVQKHVIMIEGILKFLGVISILASIAAGLVEIFK